MSCIVPALTQENMHFVVNLYIWILFTLFLSCGCCADQFLIFAGDFKFHEGGGDAQTAAPQTHASYGSSPGSAGLSGAPAVAGTAPGNNDGGHATDVRE